MTRTYKNKSIDDCIILLALNRCAGLELGYMKQDDNGNYAIGFTNFGA